MTVSRLRHLREDPLEEGVAMEISAVLRESLQIIAEGATELAGFEMAAVSVVSGEVLQTVAVVGDETAKAELLQLHSPIKELMAELEPAEAWGSLRFVAAERGSGHLDPYAWVPDLPASTDPTRWHPMDLLVGLLCGADGELRGVLSVDLPVDGRRPGPHQRRILQMYVRQAERAVITALERGDLEIGLAREHAVAEYRRQLIDVLSHDVLNAIGAVANAADLLRRGSHETTAARPGPATRLAEGLSIVERGAALVRTLVADMGTLSRLGDPHAPLHAEPVDVADVVRGVCAMHAADARTQDVVIEMVVPPSPVAATLDPEQLVVLGDRNDLTRLVANLVSNALKYSHPGGRVTVTLQQVVGSDHRGAPRVELLVADRGIGISQEDQARLYEEFFRADDPAVRRRPGLGLGLTIVHRILIRHGGDIQVQSAPGEGATFRITLPAHVTDRQAGAYPGRDSNPH
jgi:signal transduction histidine kinase